MEGKQNKKLTREVVVALRETDVREPRGGNQKQPEGRQTGKRPVCLL